MTSSPNPRRYYHTPSQLAAEPVGRWHYEPQWAIERRRRERAEAITSYQRQLALRARWSRHELLMAGYHLGPVPYGYRSQAHGQRRRLVPDPATAHVVALIFRWRVTGGLGCAAIARLLSTRPGTCPRPVNSRTGAHQTWTAARVRAILANPRYTGRQVLPLRPAPPRGEQEPAEWTPRRRWVASPPAHQALITDDMFRAAEQLAGPSAPLWLYRQPPLTPPVHTEPGGTEPGASQVDDWPTSA